PIRSLKGFKRIRLNPGERKTVSFTLTPEDLAIYRLGEGWSVNPGKVSVTVGGGQPGTKAPVISSSVILNGEKYTISK
ncbi:MAG: fibronectin type III-like domain-contianing protein, partial [Muribaculaceae bacterium]|nr:fibronectin type III-like domain-contianing protein [Muribaculaceae bacterium]